MAKAKKVELSEETKAAVKQADKIRESLTPKKHAKAEAPKAEDKADNKEEKKADKKNAEASTANKADGVANSQSEGNITKTEENK